MRNVLPSDVVPVTVLLDLDLGESTETPWGKCLSMSMSRDEARLVSVLLVVEVVVLLDMDFLLEEWNRLESERGIFDSLLGWLVCGLIDL
jgi:hypothetical protein